MSQAILTQILEQLPSLELSELQQLQQVVEDYLTNQETAKRVTFHQALLDSGLVRQIKQPPYQYSTAHQPLQIQGEPISRTMIEERR